MTDNSTNGDKNVWGDGTPWKTKSAFMGYLRGCLRKAWMRHPTKLNFIKNNRYKIPNPNKKGKFKYVFGFCCEICNNEYVMSECQVDHRNPAGKLSEKEHIQGFVERLIWVTEDDLRMCCKHCNAILAYADKHDISFEEAKLEKEVIAFSKLTTLKQSDILLKLGASQSEISNASKRKDYYREYLKRIDKE